MAAKQVEFFIPGRVQGVVNNLENITAVIKEDEFILLLEVGKTFSVQRKQGEPFKK